MNIKGQFDGEQVCISPCDEEAAVTIGTAIFWGFILMGIIQAFGLIIAAMILKWQGGCW